VDQFFIPFLCEMDNSLCIKRLVYETTVTLKYYSGIESESTKPNTKVEQ